MGRRSNRALRLAIARDQGRKQAYVEATARHLAESDQRFHDAVKRSAEADARLLHIIENELPATRAELREILA